MKRQARGLAARPQAESLRHYRPDDVLLLTLDFIMGCSPRFDYLPGAPIFHECQRCAACCRWPGQVRLTEVEITRLVAFKALSEHDFIQEFTRLSQDQCGLALQEKANGECVFPEGNDYAVQAVKPQQCRDFPNLWNFPGAEKNCRHPAPCLGNGIRPARRSGHRPARA